MAIADRIYRTLPTLGQHAAVSVYGVWWKQLRLGGAFQEHVRRFRKRDHYDASQWRAWQQRAISEVLHLADRHVAYYRDTWTEEQKRSARAGDLSGVPLLDKDPLRQDPHQFVDDRRRGTCKELAFRTSGSTGTPVTSLWTRDELQASMAVREVRSAGWANVSFHDPRATFSGRISVPNPDSKGPFHRINLSERQIYFSPFHLGPTTAAQYVKALSDHRIEWLTGYAVSFFLLARIMLEQNLHSPDSLRAVIPTSEKLLPAMRATMQEAYGANVFEEYSTVENVLFASECEHGSLHASPDVGVIEILDEDGNPCPPGVVGEVVATQTLRRYQPLIRFRIGDMASWAETDCPCGRGMPILAGVEGRTTDVVRRPDTGQQVRLHGLFIDLDAVHEGQIVQLAKRPLEIRLVLDETTPQPEKQARQDRAEKIVMDRVQQRLGNSVECTISWVPAIERTPAGKYREVISNLGDDA